MLVHSGWPVIGATSPPRAGHRPGQHAGGGHPLVLERGEGAREHRLGDRGDRRTEHQGVDAGPFAGALLPCRIQDQIDEGAARLLVGPREDPGGDLDEVARQLALVPVREDPAHGAGPDAADPSEQRIRLGDHLHVAVLDAVVHHLHVVAGPVGTNPLAAWDATADLRGDGLEDRLDHRPGAGVAARHDARPEQGAFLPAGDAGPDVEDPLFRQRAGAPRGVPGGASCRRRSARPRHRAEARGCR